MVVSLEVHSTGRSLSTFPSASRAMAVAMTVSPIPTLIPAGVTSRLATGTLQSSSKAVLELPLCATATERGFVPSP
jgi:hypothetical protein